MEDLDSLLEDLGRGKSSTVNSRISRPVSSRVDLNELEDLMEDLAAPTPKKIPQLSSTGFGSSTPQQLSSKISSPLEQKNTQTNPNINRSSFTEPSSSSSSWSSSSSSSSSSTTTTTTINSPPLANPVTATNPTMVSQPDKPISVQNSSPTQNSASSSAADELDALMESLNAASRGNRKSGKPVTSSSSSSLSSETSKGASNPVGNRGSGNTGIYSDGLSEFGSDDKMKNSSNRSPPVYKPPPPPPTAISSSSTISRVDPSAKMAPTNTPTVGSSSAGGKIDDLDSLLSNLNDQMNNISSSTSLGASSSVQSRGSCQTCKQPIFGEIIQASGKFYHPEHFICVNCKIPLGTAPFFEQNGQTHCERCFQEMFCPRCGHCEKPVMDRCITALGKKWHVDHFICTQCLNPFNGGNFFEKDGRPYCETDFFNLFAPKCASCNEPIKGDCINALGSQWHQEHFACSYCSKSFVGGTFFEYNGKPYCEIHYHQQLGSVCGGCGKPITGRCVNALNKKWHPEHFVCAFCMNPLAGGSFTEHNNKGYCKDCHGKLFGN